MITGPTCTMHVLVTSHMIFRRIEFKSYSDEIVDYFACITKVKLVIREEMKGKRVTVNGKKFEIKLFSPEGKSE